MSKKIVKDRGVPCLGTVIAATLLLSAQASHAQTPVAPVQADDKGGLDDIVVVARKRAENVQNVPISITALGGDDLKNRNILRVQDMVGNVPNMASDGGGSVLGAFGLRGIVSQTRNIGFDSGLGVYVDGVLTVRPNGADQELPDIASVEVLRGPQGTLFGRNTTAGAINITTRRPELSHIVLEGRAAIGNLQAREASLFVSGPLVADRLGVKLSGSIARRGGYLNNIVDGGKLNGLRRATVRGGLLWKATDDVEVTLNGSYLDQRDSLILGQITNPDTGNFGGTPGRLLPGFFSDPYTVAQDSPNLQTRRIVTTDLHIDWQVGGHTLTSITAYGDNRARNRDDDDSRPFRASESDFQDSAKQFTQEVRLASPTGGSFDYLLGVFYLNQAAAANRATTIVAGPAVGAVSSVSDLDTEAVAGFVSGNWRLSPLLTLSGGLRYGTEVKRLDFVQTNTSVVPLPALAAKLRRRDSDISGNASLTYEFVPNARVYASVARGFKSGGFNPDIVGSTEIGFGPENVWSYETGFKSELFDRKVRVNASAFYSDYRDLQVSALSGFAFQIRNAAAAKIKGGELEITARPVQWLDLNFGAGYTDATYKNFPGCAVSPAGATVNCAGNRLPYVPKWTLNAGAQLTVPVGSGAIVTRADVTYRGNTFYEPTNGQDGNLPGYALVNGRIGYETQDKGLGVALFARNLFDKRYRDFTFILPPFQQRASRYAPPRLYGVEVTGRF